MLRSALRQSLLLAWLTPPCCTRQPRDRSLIEQDIRFMYVLGGVATLQLKHSMAPCSNSSELSEPAAMS